MPDLTEAEIATQWEEREKSLIKCIHRVIKGG